MFVWLFSVSFFVYFLPQMNCIPAFKDTVYVSSLTKQHNNFNGLKSLWNTGSTGTEWDILTVTIWVSSQNHISKQPDKDGSWVGMQSTHVYWSAMVSVLTNPFLLACLLGFFPHPSLTEASRWIRSPRPHFSVSYTRTSSFYSSIILVLGVFLP